MVQQLDKWKKDCILMEAFFSDNQIKKISRKIRKLKPANILFCSFESRFARSGGLAMVMMKMLPFLREIPGIKRVALMAPFYPHIMDPKILEDTGKSVDVVFEGKAVNVQLLKYVHPDTKVDEKDPGIEEYYFKADTFFEADNEIGNPYGYYSEDPELNDEAISHNSLFYCKTVPFAAAELGFKDDVVFHLQDWETALVALTVKESMLTNTLGSCGTVITLHNAFDSWVSAEKLWKLTDDKKILDYPPFRKKGGFNANEIGLQLVDGPVSTVSDNFADELTDDLLQSGHFAPHLKEIFKRDGVYGVNNGLFIQFPPQFAPGTNYSIDYIRGVKMEKRKKLLEVLHHYRPEERFGSLSYKNGPITDLPDSVPILTMSGRLDPFQKGFDVLLRAIEGFERDEVKLILSPLPVKKSDMDYFHEVACKCRGNVTVLPIFMKRGYQELQMGSTFGLMPSIYEPFGAAIEYMVSGTVTIARNTGGLADQIQHKYCGMLFREDHKTYTLENIRAYAESVDIVQLRKRNKWFLSMADSLHSVIREAIDIYRNRPNFYYRMVISGFEQASTFTWDKAAQKYYEIYKKINT